MSKRKQHSVVARTYNKQGKLLSVAKNSYTKTHSLQAKYGALTGRESAIYLHAETAALLQAREQVYRIEILRLTADGKSALAKPCAACMGIIEAFEVTEVIFTQP